MIVPRGPRPNAPAAPPGAGAGASPAAQSPRPCPSPARPHESLAAAALPLLSGLLRLMMHAIDSQPMHAAHPPARALILPCRSLRS